jgi:4'-phosphopantetheinyl transferase
MKMEHFFIEESIYQKHFIWIFHFKITDKLTYEKADELISFIPLSEQEKLLGKSNKNAQQQTLIGRLMLKYFMELLGNSNYPAIKYSSSGKPAFTFAIDQCFNISHSGNMVVCAFTNHSMIGIDIEKVRPINIEVYRNCFNLMEWEYIVENKNQQLAFLNLWVRKESVLKADGSGFALDLQSINCLEHAVNVNERTFYLESLDFNSQILCTVACDSKKTIVLKDFNEIFEEKYLNNLQQIC